MFSCRKEEDYQIGKGEKGEQERQRRAGSRRRGIGKRQRQRVLWCVKEFDWQTKGRGFVAGDFASQEEAVRP